MGRFKEVKSVVYISGRGGDAGSGLGAFLKDRVERFSGLSIDSELLKLPFDRQVASVADFTFKLGTGPVVANSYGAYLFVHSLIDAREFPRRVLLFSPLLGSSLKKDKMFFSRPPGLGTLEKALLEKRVTKPTYLEIQTGADDDVCCPELAGRVGRILGVDKLKIIPGEGHQISRSVVASVCDEFLIDKFV